MPDQKISADPQATTTVGLELAGIQDGVNKRATPALLRDGLASTSTVTALTGRVASLEQTPPAHAASHAAAGSDPITPAAIGASAVGHTHSDATSGAAGFMSAADKAKLDRLAHQALTDGASIAWNVANGAAASVTLGGNRTLANPSGLQAGGTYVLIVKQDATGSRTLAYGSAYKWPGGTAPTLSTAANAVDVLTFISDGTALYGVAAKAFA